SCPAGSLASSPATPIPRSWTPSSGAASAGASRCMPSTWATCCRCGGRGAAPPPSGTSPPSWPDAASRTCRRRSGAGPNCCSRKATGASTGARTWKRSWRCSTPSSTSPPERCPPHRGLLAGDDELAERDPELPAGALALQPQGDLALGHHRGGGVLDRAGAGFGRDIGAEQLLDVRD